MSEIDLTPEAIERHIWRGVAETDEQESWIRENNAFLRALSARVVELEAERAKDHAEINIKADFIDATINQLAAAEAALATARADALREAAQWANEKLARAKNSKDEAKALGASMDIQRSWRAVIAHLSEAPEAILALIPQQEKPRE